MYKTSVISKQQDHPNANDRHELGENPKRQKRIDPENIFSNLPRKPQQNRVIVVSNRLENPEQQTKGGLAVSVKEALFEKESIWLGWSGKISETKPRKPSFTQYNKTVMMQIDLTQKEHDNYYLGYCNATLWPGMHQQAQKIVFKPEYYSGYIDVNRTFSNYLRPLLNPEDIIWIHDFHLSAIAKELRAVGCKQKMGFFNHISFPEVNEFKKIPHYKQFAENLLSFDLVGMQTTNDAKNFKNYLSNTEIDKNTYINLKKNGIYNIKTFPIGISIRNFLSSNTATEQHSIINFIKKEAKYKTIMLGVERLDYIKGIKYKFRALDVFLEKRPEFKERLILLQIAPFSREKIPTYQKLISKTQKIADGVNKKHCTKIWNPIIYSNQHIPRQALPTLYKTSDICVVNSNLEGMNLVAKEYIASQDEKNPGTLILSKGAGAAEQLNEAILVPPKNTNALSDAYEKALHISLTERQERHKKLLSNVQNESLEKWAENYLDALYKA